MMISPMFGDVLPGAIARSKLAKRITGHQAGFMKNLPSLALLVIFSCIGLLTGKFGLWFPLGLAAAVILAVVRNGRKTDDR